MAFYYNVFINETPPDRPIGGWYWIKPSIGQLYIYILDGWKPIAGDQSFVTPSIGSHYYCTIEQESVPGGTDNIVGKIWIKTSINQAFMKLSQWLPIAGG